MGEARSKRTFHLSSILSVHQRALPPDEWGGGRGRGRGEEGEDSCRMHHSPTPIFSLLLFPYLSPSSPELRKIHFHYLRPKIQTTTVREKNQIPKSVSATLEKGLFLGVAKRRLLGNSARDKISQSGRERVTARPSTTVWHPGPTQPPQGPRG